MIFGWVPVSDSRGAILAHAVKRDDMAFKKGHVIDDDAVRRMRAAGIDRVVAARLEPDDVHEDEAARQLAERLCGDVLIRDTAFTGRCNLLAERHGLFLAEAETVDRINLVDERITVATLPPLRRVTPREIVATIKIIPFAVPRRMLDESLAAASANRFAVAPFRPLRVGVVSTLLPGLKSSVIAKTLRTLDARLAAAEAKVVSELRVPHETGALSEALRDVAADSDLVIVFGASAITDRRDVIPVAIEAAGGHVIHLGMPVDPGNLLLIGTTLEGKPVIGAPGCARSPKQNGFDFVLDRLLAGIPVGSMDIRRMGVGGLLTEIATRGLPRSSDE